MGFAHTKAGRCFRIHPDDAFLPKIFTRPFKVFGRGNQADGPGIASKRKCGQFVFGNECFQLLKQKAP